MSKYTTEVRNICETYAGLKDRAEYTDVDRVIDLSYKKIFDYNNIPVYVPEHKDLLFKKILLHYYQREIGFETAGLWKFKLNNKLKEIMPYYNQLYASELLEYDPLQNVNNWHEHEGVYEDTSKVDNKRKYDNTTDTENAQGTENTTKYDNRTDTENAEGTEHTKKYDNTTQSSKEKNSLNVETYQNETNTQNSGVSNSAADGQITDTGSADSLFNEVEDVTLRHTKKTSRGDDTKTHEGIEGKDQWTLFSDTPQGGINGVQAGGGPGGSGTLAGDAYLSNATHMWDKDGKYTDTSTFGDVTETYNPTSEKSDTTERTGSSTDTTSNNRITTNSERSGSANQGLQLDNSTDTTTYNETDTGTVTDDANTLETGSKIGSGNKVDDALTHEVGSKIASGTQVDDALTVDDNLRKDNGTDAHTNREYGKIGVMTYQEMVLKYRDTFLNIDMMIIDELKDLFMKVW